MLTASIIFRGGCDPGPEYPSRWKFLTKVVGDFSVSRVVAGFWIRSISIFGANVVLNIALDQLRVHIWDREALVRAAKRIHCEKTMKTTASRLFAVYLGFRIILAAYEMSAYSCVLIQWLGQLGR